MLVSLLESTELWQHLIREVSPRDAPRSVSGIRIPTLGVHRDVCHTVRHEPEHTSINATGVLGCFSMYDESEFYCFGAFECAVFSVFLRHHVDIKFQTRTEPE